MSCENNGLAGTLYTTCTRRTQRFKGHKTKCGHKLMPVVTKYNRQDMRRYAINRKSIIATHLCGLGFYNVRALFTFLDLPFMSFNAYKRCEKLVGEKGLSAISQKVQVEALQEEIKQTTKTYRTEKYGDLPALSVSLDMGWQKRSSGRRFGFV